jgi:hypothetical protein
MDFFGGFMRTIYQEFEEMDEEEAFALSTRDLARPSPRSLGVCASAEMANLIRP